MRNISIIVFLVFVSLAQASKPAPVKSLRLTVINPAPVDTEANVSLSLAELKRIAPDFKPENALVKASDTGRATSSVPLEIPSQLDDFDGDGAADELAFQIALHPKQSRMVSITYGGDGDSIRNSYPKRAYAKFAQKYEGMGWESERTAWRLYFDQRNAIDLFGKRRPGLLLDHFGTPGVDYHAESPDGRDIYRIGAALGIGAVGAWVNGKAVKVAEVTERKQRVIGAGPVRAVVELSYRGWKVAGGSVDLTSRITQWAGERGFEHRVFLQPGHGVVLVAGLPRQPGLVELLTPPTRSGEVYSLGTWGHQVLGPGARTVDSLPDQNLGLALLVPQASAEDTIAGDPANYLIRIPLQNGSGRWYVTAAWDQEEKAAGRRQSTVFRNQPLTSQENFTAYLKEERTRLAHPIKIQWEKK
jgi:Domain of unknown function (DUF4861)